MIHRAIAFACLLMLTSPGMASDFYPEVARYIEASVAEFDRIPEERKRALQRVARYVEERLDAREEARLTFICTHNSRRSHMSQIWAQTAAAHYGVDNVRTYSGGTETTAFNPRAVAAMSRAGFAVEPSSGGSNPVYVVRNGTRQQAMTAFSKTYFDDSNPQEDFCAVMTCSQADESCPIVQGAGYRVSIPYDDPKAFDGTGLEAAKYDERCRQISREMLYLFSRVRT